MKYLTRCIIMATMAMTFLSTSFVCAAEARKPLTKKEQAAFLAKRTKADGLLNFGSLNSLASMLYATKDVIIHFEDKDLGKTRMQSPFPKFYKPTWREFFDYLARHTKTSWRYSPKDNCWVFGKPVMPTLFRLEMADGWKMRNQGSCVLYRPPSAPVGMDVYFMGTYSTDDPKKQNELDKKVKETIALGVAKRFKPDVDVKDMTNVKVGSLDGLYFHAKAPKTVIIWRQWIIVDHGTAFAIFSAIKPELEQQVFPDVEKMLKSFALVKNEKPKTSKPNTSDNK